MLRVLISADPPLSILLPTTNLNYNQMDKITVQTTGKPNVMVPPLNFALVSPNVYRSGYPNKKNFPFILRLKLRSVLYLSDDDHSIENSEFLCKNNIQLFHIRLKSKDSNLGQARGAIADALAQVLNSANHPSNNI